MSRRAVVIGATGATGKHLLHQLLQSNQWSKVSVIHRREVDMNALQAEISPLTSEQLNKLSQHVIDMSKLATDESIGHLFDNHDTTFCTLGTTRNKSPSAEQYLAVDLHMVRNAAIASRKAGVQHFSLLTSSGANKNMPSLEWKISHPLFYMQTKGKAEQAVIDLQFPRTSIFRPGMLDRQQAHGRAFERIALKILSSTAVSTVARAMIVDAECESESNAIEKPLFYDIGTIQLIGRNSQM